MKRLFKKLHLWLSIPVGLIISTTCFSGAMLIFEKEITALCINTTVDAKEKILPIDTLAGIVAENIPNGVEVTGVTITNDPNKAYTVNISKPHHAGIYIDQYTGEIMGKKERLPFFNVMLRLHRWFMDDAPRNGGTWGRPLVGVSTIIFVFILITGFAIWLPHNKKLLKNRVKIVSNKGWRRFWYDLHVAGGFYALILLLAMALTGLTWSFQWYRNSFYNIFGVETAKSATNNDKKSTKKGEKKERELSFTHWQAVVDKIAQENPDYKQISVSSGSATVATESFGNQRASDKYTFDVKTGEITDRIVYENSKPQDKMKGWIYSVHVGSWGGLLTRILYFLVAMLGASLPLTGYYLWIKRTFIKRK